MAGDLTDTGELFPASVGLIFVFNLIVGTGALTMPRAFADAGWLISIIIVTLLAIMSYLTVTFVIESMAAANAIRKINRLNGSDGIAVDDNSISDNERRPLLGPAIRDPSRANRNVTNSGYFDIAERIEMGQMASMFFNRVGVWAFYICMVVYLYGDLAIYAAAVPKSLRDVACTYKLNNSTGNESELSDADPCWPNQPHINRMNAYRIFLGAFTLLLGPFIFFNVQKTKYLQYFTTLMRWLAFSMMIVLAIIRLAKGEGEGRPSMGKVAGIPTLFGVCVYSFMCHHSLPSLTTPIRDKSKLFGLFAGDYTLILVFYCLLSLTGIFSFAHLDDLYTLNFQPNTSDGSNPITNVVFIQYFLALFPVFTLSTNFPIIGITLRNNLKTMCLTEGKQYHCLIDRIMFPLLTLIPPLIIAFITNEVDFLVGITGSYAGAAIQYFVPAALVFCARRTVSNALGGNIVNQHTSPFRHVGWFIFVIVWGTLCVTFVTVNHIITRK